MTQLGKQRSTEKLVPPRDLPEMVRSARLEQGLNREQAARVLGVSVESIVQAESQTYQGRLRMRKRILEAFSGVTLDGPYYRLVRLDEEE